MQTKNIGDSLVVPQGLTQTKGLIRNLVGQRFNRLAVYARVGAKNGISYWLCRCDCGAFKIVAGTHLSDGHTQSCGCYRADQTRKASITHGMSNSPVYAVWVNMNSRCYIPTSTSYPWYGAKGVTVDDRWRHSFENFYADMGDLPFHGASIERSNSKLGYSPDSCKWETKKNQARNQSRNVHYTLDGQTRCLAEWAEIADQNYKKVWSRLDLGWSLEEALGFKERSLVIEGRDGGRFAPNPQAKQNTDLTNQRFGKLIALRPDKSRRHVVWHCLCDCGKSTFSRATRLIRGETLSCRSCSKIGSHPKRRVRVI